MYPHQLHRHHRPLPPDCAMAAVRHGHQFVEIILLKEELLHDITADITRLEKARQLDQPILTNEDADGYTLGRQIDRAVDKAVSCMQAYLFLPSPFVHRISGNHVSQWEEKSIYLALPPNWPPHCIDPLRDAVHRYVVESVKYNILLISLSSDPYTAMCRMEADEAYNEIGSLISTRLGPVRVHPTIFG